MDYNFALFNAITDALAQLEQVKETLVTAQQQAEDSYVSAGD